MVLKAIELTLGSAVLAVPHLWLSAVQLHATTAPPLSLSSSPSIPLYPLSLDPS